MALARIIIIPKAIPIISFIRIRIKVIVNEIIIV